MYANKALLFVIQISTMFSYRSPDISVDKYISVHIRGTACESYGQQLIGN